MERQVEYLSIFVIQQHFISKFSQKHAVMTHLLSPQDTNTRLKQAIRNIQQHIFRHAKARSNPLSSLSLPSSAHLQTRPQTVFPALNDTLVWVEHTLGGVWHRNVGARMKSNYILTVIESEEGEEAIQNCSAFRLIEGGGQHRPIPVNKIYRIPVKQIYFQHQYQIIVLQISSALPTIGYNFAAFPYKDQRRARMAAREDVVFKERLVYDLSNDKFHEIHLYPFGDITYNSCMENADLPFLPCGSPLLQKIGHQLFLIGFYCIRYLFPTEDYHGILLLNPQVLEKLQKALPKTAAQQIYLQYNTSKKINLSHIETLSQISFKCLSKINLDSHRVGRKGIKLMVRAQWPEVTDLSLDGNLIDCASVEYLIKANWKKLHSLALVNNVIANQGVTRFSRAHWQLLSYLNLYRNRYDQLGFIHFLLNDWTILSSLNLQKSTKMAWTMKAIERRFVHRFCRLAQFSL